jgi:hypothetical protein
MKNYNGYHLQSTPAIQCVEVLIPDKSISANDLYRTLSLYSLQNEALANNPTNADQQGFHFMLYDWLRTLKVVLDDRKIFYTIIKCFSLPDIHSNGNDAAADPAYIASDAMLI